MKPGDFTGKGELVVGTVRGFRRWDVRDGQLRAVSHLDRWHQGENRATCHFGFYSWQPGHRVAGAACTCGFYAYFDPSHARFSGDVEGVIEGYGRVTVGSKGFRAEKARILGLVAPRFHLNLVLPWTLGQVLWLIFVTGPMADQNPIPIIANLLSLVACIVFSILIVAWGGWRELVSFQPKLREQIRKGYPDVPLFRSRRALLKAFPLEPAEYAHLKAAA